MKFLSIFMLLFILFVSVSCVTASNLNEDSYYLNYHFLNEYSNFFNLLKVDSDNLHNYTSNLINNVKDNSSDILFNNNSTNKNNNVINNQFNKSDSKLNNISSVINSSNIYPNNSNLVNNSVDKNKQCKVLFNDTSSNQNQFNKSFKLFELSNDISDNDNSNNLISKEFNNSKLNNSVGNDSIEDNYRNYVPESQKQDNNYIMFLIPILLVLEAIILYKIKK